MSEDLDPDTTNWLRQKSADTTLTLQLARELAGLTRMGWYIAPIASKFSVGKITMTRLSQRHPIRTGDGQVMLFDSLDQARAFLREQLGILSPIEFPF